MLSWYWVADFCEEQGIEFVLGHALYMKAIHGAKAKNDRIDSEKFARLPAGGMFPVAYVYRSPRVWMPVFLLPLTGRRLICVRSHSVLVAQTRIEQDHPLFHTKVLWAQ